MSAATMEVRLDPLATPRAEIPLVEVVASPTQVVLGAGLAGPTLVVRGSLAGRHWVSGGEVVRPIATTVTGIEGGSLLVEDPTTGVHGIGQDLAAAVNDFRAALVEHRDVLASAPRLSEDLADQLAFLRQHLRAQ